MSGSTARAYPNSDARKSGNLPLFSAEVRRALSAWTRAKEALRKLMLQEDFQAFIRPMYLVGVLSGRFFLIALPPNRRIIERAHNFRPNLHSAVAREGYALAGFVRYPNADDLYHMAHVPALAPFAEIICRKRNRNLEAIAQTRSEQNARDVDDQIARELGRWA